MSAVGGRIEPFYFGLPDKALFGLYQTPPNDSIRDCGIVLSYPMGHEYTQFHRAFRLLGDRFCAVGFPVLRFDFYGCGDSSGDNEDGRIDQWLEDISMAIAEVRRRGGILKVSLVGLRLGASLAMMIAAESGGIDSLVLWDPIISGKTYIAESMAMHRQMVGTANVVLRDSRADQRLTETLGFPITHQLMAGLETVDLLMIEQKPAGKILLIESHLRTHSEGLMNHLGTVGAEVNYQHLPSPHLWEWNDNFGNILVPHQTLQSIVKWASEVHP